MTDRRTDGRTDRRTDARGKTICLPTLSEGDIIKRFLSTDHRVQFYKSYIQPHIDFCNIVWGSSSESNIQKLFKLQKRACKIILDFNVDNGDEAMNTLKIMSIYDRVHLRKAKFMFKVYNDLISTYIYIRKLYFKKQCQYKY